MKKNVLYTGALLLLFGTAATAQTEMKTDSMPATTTSSTVQTYANYRPKSAELIPMPEALTDEKKFPAIGQYQVTDKAGVASTVTVTLDPENRGVVWVEGLPQGKFKAHLKKSPAIYKIPVQTLEPEVAAEPVVEAEATTAKKSKTAKTPAPKQLAEGTLIVDRDANTINILIGSKYNEEDPNAAFATATTEESTAEVEKKPAKKGAAKAKVAKTWQYSGTKVVAEPVTPEAAPAPAPAPSM